MFLPPEQKVAEITKILEDNLGIPAWKGRGNPLGSLILTVLSQSTNDRNRDTAYKRLKQSFPDWEAVMNSPADKIADAIRPAGLANQKSQRIKDILKWVYATYGSFNLDCLCDMESEQVIDTFLNLKGVGIKTISVVLMYTCGKDIFPVDTHVHRICKRLDLVPEKTSAEKTHHLMQPLVPEGKSYSLHMNFLQLGRTICKAQTPKCQQCPLMDICPSASVFLNNTPQK